MVFFLTWLYTAKCKFWTVDRRTFTLSPFWSSRKELSRPHPFFWSKYSWRQDIADQSRKHLIFLYFFLSLLYVIKRKFWTDGHRTFKLSPFWSSWKELSKPYLFFWSKKARRQDIDNQSRKTQILWYSSIARHSENFESKTGTPRYGPRKLIFGI